jgi:CheY-like chemotaxis protein
MNELILKNANILIVDDQQANIDVLIGLLDAKGFINYTATKDSRQVFKLFDEFNPDLLLLDLKMPNLSGFEVMIQLKSLIPVNTYFPILVLTADITQESKQKALAAGASDFITKPFDLIEVDLRINNLLKVRYLHQQLENQKIILEEKMREKTKELEKINIELKVAIEKAEQSDKLKSELLDQIKRMKNQINNNLRIDELTDQQTEIILNNGTILYVKDKLSNVQLVEQILAEHRSTIRLVTNMYGKNTVQFAIDYTPDLILLDLSLPDIHGSEVIKLLQTEPRTAAIPVIILSEYAISVQIEKIIAAGGAKDYLMKPIDKDQFLKRVDEWIKKSSNRKK